MRCYRLGVYKNGVDVGAMRVGERRRSSRGLVEENNRSEGASRFVREICREKVLYTRDGKPKSIRNSNVSAFKKVLRKSYQV